MTSLCRQTTSVWRTNGFIFASCARWDGYMVAFDPYIVEERRYPDTITTDNRLGPVSTSDKTSYRKISWNLEATRLVDWIILSLWNLTGMSTALLPMSVFANFQQFWIQILGLQYFARLYSKMSYRKRAPDNHHITNQQLQCLNDLVFVS